MKPTQSASAGSAWALWLGYVFFVVYGSLVPLQYRAQPFSEAWLAFQNIPFLRLGIESRADWVANGVLYLPVGFLTSFALLASLRRVWPPILHLMALVFCTSLAITVEFTQLFFPPRTVSLNDLMAEVIGSLLGVFIAARFGNWFAAFLHSLLNNTRRLSVLGLEAYVVAYFAFAMFPFDFLLSQSELWDKSRSENLGWLLAGESQRATVQLVKLLAETLLTVPLGLLLARLVGRKHASYALAVFAGLLLGLAVEIGQFFIASGVSQGLSVLTRVLGVCAGFGIYRYATRPEPRLTWEGAAGLVRRAAPWLAIPYLLLLLNVNGWMSQTWQGLASAKTRLAEVNFMPFYYHYYTTEAIALFSLAAVGMSYFPVGLAAWAAKRAAFLAATLAAVLAFVVETGKLFLRGSHPDPTNLLIAGASAWIAVTLLKLFAGGSKVAHSPAITTAVTPPVAAGKAKNIGAMVCLAVLAAWVASFPAMPVLVATVIAACCLIVWFKPPLAFAVIPAALPVFDLAPWSGRFFFDEFDALVVAVLAIVWARTNRRSVGAMPVRSPSDLLVVAFCGLLALSFAISTVRGLMPFTWSDANAFNNYFSNYNALRIAKGALWAALIWRLSARIAAPDDVRRQFSWGLVVGLALTVAWVLWERITFPGLPTFNDYRVTGPFSATHTGGAYIDCFLAAALPFLILTTVDQNRWTFKIAGALLILATTYALAVTFSRAGYLAFAVAAAGVLTSLVFRSGKKLRYAFALAGLAVTMLVVALPVFKSEFMQSRLAGVSADFDFRKAHWRDALAIRDADLLTTLFGMGVGRFPETKYWRSTLHPKIATYQLKSEKLGGRDNTFLRLDAGQAIGVEQWVAMEPGQSYRLKFDVRPSHAYTKVSFPICEKWLLTSARCVEPSVDLGALKDSWRSVEVPVDTQALAPPLASPFARPLKLALTHAMANSTIDLDNLRLLAPDGRDLLRNGNFTQGLDHWFFSVSGTSHTHWRTNNLFVAVLFDQGWLGLLAVTGLLVLALAKGSESAWRGDLLAGAALASVCGFLVGGLFEAQIDAPRFLLLLLLLIWACMRDRPMFR